MKALALIAVLVLVGVVAPAQAEKSTPVKIPKAHAQKLAESKRGKCAPRAEATNASGTLVMATLRPHGHGRYSGTLEVNVTRANHRAILTTDQTYKLTNARVMFHRGVNRAAPAPGSGIKVSGTITVLPSGHCPIANFTPTITVTKVDVEPRGQHGPPSHPRVLL